MAEKLPWFPFYATDWVTDPRVLALSNEQRGIFHWLLCRQWMDGHIPGDPAFVYPLLPPGADSNAVGFVLNQFFPSDPDDATKRANPRLCDIRCEQEAKLQSEKNKTKAARAAKAAKRRGTTTSVPSVTVPVTGVDIESETESEKDVGVPHGISPLLWSSGKAFLADPKTRMARLGEIKMLLGGARGAKVTEAAVARALNDMGVAGAPFSAVVLKRFAERAVRLLEGEAGQRAAQETLKGPSSVSRQPDANQGHPEGFSEDEMEP